MQVEDLVLMSTDDHVVEPPSMSEYFRDHVPAKFRDRVPKVIRRPDGTDAWLIEGKEIATFGLNAVQGRPREAWGADPASFDQVRPGTYDIHERVRDMNVNGVLASICFPSWPGIAGQFFVASEDLEYAGAMVSAYNDWHIESGVGPTPVGSSRSPSPASRSERNGWPPRSAAAPTGAVTPCPCTPRPTGPATPTITGTSGTRRGRPVRRLGR